MRANSHPAAPISNHLESMEFSFRPPCPPEGLKERCFPSSAGWEKPFRPVSDPAGRGRPGR